MAWPSALRRLLLGIVSCALALGCGPAAKVDVEVRSEEVVLRVTTVPHATAWAGARMAEAGDDGIAELRIPASELPVGAQRFPFAVSMDGHTRDLVATFDRPKVPSRLFVTGASSHFAMGLTVPCGSPECNGDLGLGFDGFVRLTLATPPGSTITIGQRTFPPVATREQDVEVDVSSLLLAFDVASLEDGWTSRRQGPFPAVPLSVRVVSADGVAAEHVLSLVPKQHSGETNVQRALANVGRVPYRIGADPVLPTSKHVVYRPRYRRFEGSGTLADVDLVAVETITNHRRVGACQAYVTVVNGVASGYAEELFAIDDEVTVYERRTGREVAKRTFEGTSECTGDVTTPGGPPKQEAPLVAWLASLR